MTKVTAKTILCYGDSNTWGNVPNSDLRYPRGVRWPSALQNILGEEYEVISEGLCGRALKSDIAPAEKNGITYIQPCVESHDPLDLIVIMLGTNDVKDKYKLSPEDIASNLKETILIIRSADIVNKDNVKILVVCPAEVSISENGWHEGYFKEGMEKSRKLPELYKKVADETGCLFLNVGDYVKVSGIDGVHLDEAGHLKLAEVLADNIKTVL